MSKETILEILNTLMIEKHNSNYSVSSKINEEASKRDVYNGATDRYFHYEKREMPYKDISEENIYSSIVEKNGLDKYFSQEEIKQIYVATVYENSSRDSFYFDETFIYVMKKYVYYKDYLNETSEIITFSEFLQNKIYEKMVREESNKKWEKETKDIQENFVPKTNVELKELYEKDKAFIDKIYGDNVDDLDCMDILPFSEFLKLYDMADRNYRNVDAPVDHRVMTEIVNKYYQIFVEKRNYQENISLRDFWKMFDKCLKQENKQQFKLNISNLIDEHITNLEENIDLEQLYGSKKRV